MVWATGLEGRDSGKVEKYALLPLPQLPDINVLCIVRVKVLSMLVLELVGNKKLAVPVSTI